MSLIKHLDIKILGGVTLIIIGIALLGQNTGLFTIGNLFWGILFFLVGVFFISIFINNRQHWWGLIPAYGLLGVSILLLLETILPPIPEMLGGVIILTALALAFIHIYIIDRQNWWALIPGGVLLTLAAINGLEEFLKDTYAGGLLFIGMGLTFASLPLLPSPQKDLLKWAWIPAGILFFIGIYILGISEGLLQIIGAILLILIGLFFIIRTLIRRL